MKILVLLVVLTALILPTAIFAQPPAQTPPLPCVPSAGDVHFVCGHTAPEDLVLVPGSEWVVATSYGGTGGIRIVNVKTKVTTLAYPSSTAKEQQDKKTYAACPGPPDAAQKAMFTTHGIALREGKNSLHTLYVVNHGKRESIEVFELNAKMSPPVLTWMSSR